MSHSKHVELTMGLGEKKRRWPGSGYKSTLQTLPMFSNTKYKLLYILTIQKLRCR